MNYVTGVHGTMGAKGELVLEFKPPASKLGRLILQVGRAGPIQRLRHYRHKNVVSHVTAATQDKRRKVVRNRTIVESFSVRTSVGTVELLFGSVPFMCFDANAFAAELEGPILSEHSLVRVRLSTRAPLDSRILASLVTHR